MKEAEDETYITRMKRISDGRRLRMKIKLGGRLKSRNEKALAKLRVEYECYKLCCCKNKECGHKLWHRDTNAAINMIKPNHCKRICWCQVGFSITPCDSCERPGRIDCEPNRALHCRCCDGSRNCHSCGSCFAEKSRRFWLRSWGWFFSWE